jgi:hypothetical protein
MNLMKRPSLLLAGMVVGLCHPAAAHNFLTAYIQHSIQLTVGAGRIDLTVDLTFFEQWSEHERRAMDADADGRISLREQDSYLKKMSPKLCQQVKLRVAGRKLELIPLYDPEIDLLADDKVEPAHHRLRLFFFVASPAALRAGDEIVVEDSLWPQAKVLGTPQVVGRDGAELTTEIRTNSGRERAGSDAGRLFKFRCVKPPLPKPNAPNGRAGTASKTALKTQNSNHQL